MANHGLQSFYSLRTDLKYHMILPLVAIVALPEVWEPVGFFEIIPAKYLPAPSTLVTTFPDRLVSPKPKGAALVQDLVSSIQISFVGFPTAIIIGIPLGLLMGFYESSNQFVKPVFEMICPIPPIAWVPLTIVMLGIGFETGVFIICFTALIPYVMSAYTGIKLTNPTLVQVARVCGTPNLQVFFKVCTPSPVQMVFAGVQITLSASWSTPVVTGMLTSSSGLGYMIQMGCLLARPDLIILGILITGIIGFLPPALLIVLEQNLAKWRVVR